MRKLAALFAAVALSVVFAGTASAAIAPKPKWPAPVIQCVKAPCP